MATINDVAKRAGVSPVTVSRVINDAPNVRPATRARVERAIQELGYVPSVAARSLRSKQTRTLALVLPDITNSFWTTIARGVEDTAQGRGYSVLLYNTDETPSKQSRCLDVIASQRVDGVIIAPYDSDAHNLVKLQTRQIPTAIIDRRSKGWEVDTVYGDSVSGARALVRHLIKLGHKQVAIVSGPVGASTAEDRVAGYRMALTEAGIPANLRLIKRGEFRAVSGERLTYQLLDEGLEPTAIFAANNVIALGVIDALEKRGLRIPQDVALVCFDDFPNASRFFPFLTVAVQPAYDMGVNAAQLLLSRLDAELGLRPRQVVLPTRLIIRYSCGSQSKGEGGYVPSLPNLKEIRTQSVLVKGLNSVEIPGLSERVTGMAAPVTRQEVEPAHHERSDANRLLMALQHQEADRVPHLEFWITSKPVYEYVLGRKLGYEITNPWIDSQSITPEDHVEFALRLGTDAVACDFYWRPNNTFEKAADGRTYYLDGTIKALADLEDLEPPPPMANQLSRLERYLQAAQGTRVGVIPSFTSFFDSAMRAIGIGDALYMFHDNRPLLERLMDMLLEHQEKVVRVVCDRFADDLACILINDDIAFSTGLTIHPDMFMDIFPHRMQRLILAVKEHGKPLILHTDGKIEGILPLLHEIGFDAVHPIQPEFNDIFELKRQWAGKVAFIGNIPLALLAYGDEARIEEQVREYCIRLGPGGGYVLGSSGSITHNIPPENFVAMTQATHKYGRYSSLGHEV
ncbi:MAG: substrate-binding domain-containing protein [Anaerolineales bacterium]|nr:MAG: substrate-binding domain-containing protein [Anaerolineales bacterium]